MRVLKSDWCRREVECKWRVVGVRCPADWVRRYGGMTTSLNRLEQSMRVTTMQNAGHNINQVSKSSQNRKDPGSSTIEPSQTSFVVALQHRTQYRSRSMTIFKRLSSQLSLSSRAKSRLQTASSPPLAKGEMLLANIPASLRSIL